MKRILTILLVLMPMTTVWAQHVLRGVVRDSAGVAMPYSTIYVEDLQRGALADQKGEFLIADVPSGKHQVRASYIGYTTKQAEVEMAERDVYLAFVLHEEAISLAEVIILPEGVDFATYVMTQLEKHRQPLKKKMSAYDATVRAKLDKQIDLKHMPHKGLMRIAARMMAWGKVFNIMTKYPDFRLEMEEDVQFRNGKMKNGDLRITKIEPELNRRELKSVMQKDWFLDMNLYDKFYDEVGKKLKQLQGKNPKYKVQYKGSYEEDGRLVFILKYGHTQVEVVDECWQIRRMQYRARTRTINFEFQELLPGIFLPVAGRAEYHLDYDKFPKGDIRLSMGLQYKKPLPFGGGGGGASN